MKIIELDQDNNQEKWLNWRKGKLTASTSAPCIGIYKYKTPYMLWESLLGLDFGTPENDNMRYGKKMEPYAREAFNTRYGFDFDPICVEHETYSNIMVASLDGFDSIKGDCILEIKTPNPTRNNHFSRHLHSVEAFKAQYPTYFHQIMWQMMCCGKQVKKCYFATFHQDDIEYLKIPRDEEYISDMEKKSIAWFQKHIVERKQPKKIKVAGEKYNKGDFLFVDEDDVPAELISKAREIDSKQKELAIYIKESKALDKEKKEVVKQLAESGDDLDFFIGSDIKMIRISKAKMDLEKVCRALNLTEKEFKGSYYSAGIDYYKLSIGD